MTKRVYKSERVSEYRTYHAFGIEFEKNRIIVYGVWWVFEVGSCCTEIAYFTVCLSSLPLLSLFLFVYRSRFTINRALEAGVRAYAFMRVSAYESLTHS